MALQMEIFWEEKDKDMLKKEDHPFQYRWRIVAITPTEKLRRSTQGGRSGLTKERPGL